MGILSISDASFENEAGMKSQQGRSCFKTPGAKLKGPDCGEFMVYPLSFSPTAIKRVCAVQLRNVKRAAFKTAWKLEIGLGHSFLEMRGLENHYRQPLMVTTPSLQPPAIQPPFGLHVTAALCWTSHGASQLKSFSFPRAGPTGMRAGRRGVFEVARGEVRPTS